MSERIHTRQGAAEKKAPSPVARSLPLEGTKQSSPGDGPPTARDRLERQLIEKAGLDEGAPWTTRDRLVAGFSRADGARATPVQMLAEPTAKRMEGELVRATAEAGIEGAGGPLPHHDRIQAAFGRHDIRGVRAHVDGRASRAAHSIGALAYATGDHVAFRESPSLRTAAHEAAHTVQQRVGSRVEGGVGSPGDVHERQADAVAERVVEGRSAESLLDRGAAAAGDGARPKGPVQLLSSQEKKAFEKAAETILAEAKFHYAWSSPELVLSSNLQQENFEKLKAQLQAKSLPVNPQNLSDLVKVLEKASDRKIPYEVVAEEKKEAVDDFSQWVTVQPGVEFPDDSFRRLALSWAKGGDHSDERAAVTVGGHDLIHRTQKAGNRSLWYKKQGGKLVLYAIAEHYGQGNLNYRKLSGVSSIPNTWHL